MKEEVQQFRDLVVRPALQEIGLWSEVAELLVLGTAAVESQFRWLKQKGTGPALGLYQMEPKTHSWLIFSFIPHHFEYGSLVEGLTYSHFDNQRLIYDLKYATQMCRIKYYSSPLPLPTSVDPMELGKYWKKIYNTEQGEGTVERFVKYYLHYLK